MPVSKSTCIGNERDHTGPTDPALTRSMNAIEVRGLVKIYAGNVTANNSIDLVVPKGHIVAILGPNGAGKTTLIRQLATELEPTSGEIRILGRDAVRAPKSVRALMSVIPQEVYEYSYLTVWEHILYFAKIRGGGERQAEAVADALNLRDDLEKQVGRISGGQRRRVFLALALVDPHVQLVILDEPTAGLDPVGRQSVWEMIAQRRASGVTILFSTHYMDEAQRYADEVFLIDHGRVVSSGPPSVVSRLCGQPVIEISPGSPALLAETLDKLRGLSIDATVGDYRVRVYAARVEPELWPVLDAIVAAGGSVTFGPPSLEDAFVRTFGRT